MPCGGERCCRTGRGRWPVRQRSGRRGGIYGGQGDLFFVARIAGTRERGTRCAPKDVPTASHADVTEVQAVRSLVHAERSVIGASAAVNEASDGAGEAARGLTRGAGRVNHAFVTVT